MYTTLIERYPKSAEAETAQYHLATLAYWKKDWDKALKLYRQVAETWPDGRYADFIAEQKMPELASLMKAKGKTKRGAS
ncbi:MAG: tetratricopeptide repeat protein [Kiritimatiellia bacterium]|jgi:TolA-binding protein